MKTYMRGRPHSKEVIHIYIYIRFLRIISFVWASTNFKICSRPHRAIAYESVEGITEIEQPLLNQTEEDLEVLQSTETIDKAPNLNIFEILPQ